MAVQLRAVGLLCGVGEEGGWGRVILLIYIIYIYIFLIFGCTAFFMVGSDTGYDGPRLPIVTSIEPNQQACGVRLHVGGCSFDRPGKPVRPIPPMAIEPMGDDGRHLLVVSPGRCCNGWQ